MTWTEFTSIIYVPMAGLIFFILYLLYKMISSHEEIIRKMTVQIAEHHILIIAMTDFKKELVTRLDRIERTMCHLSGAIGRLPPRDHDSGDN